MKISANERGIHDQITMHNEFHTNKEAGIKTKKSI